MFNSRKLAWVVALLGVGAGSLALGAGADKYPGVGRAATASEIAAWDIDVRPDFKGLPAGSGSVATGQDVWEAKCASCHGVFGESNEVFSPLIGGTTADDVKAGHVARLLDPAFPGRTTLMKVATVSTVWDFIRRAMPWTAPKSLTVDEVYAVTAYLLNLGGVLPDDFTLSDKNMAQVQARMPNRNGMTRQHAMWPGKELGGVAKPDSANTLCMKDCAGEPTLASFLPDFARNAHGNLAEQNHIVGQQVGVDTTKPETKVSLATAKSMGVVQGVAVSSKAAAVVTNPANQQALALLQKNGCVACHSVDRKIVGPAFNDVARKYAGQTDYLAGKIRSGGSGVWGAVPMPAQTASGDDIQAIAQWLATGAGK